MSLHNGGSPSVNLQQAVAALTAAAVDETQAIAIQLSRDSLAELKNSTACAQVGVITSQSVVTCRHDDTVPSCQTTCVPGLYCHPCR